MIKRVLHCSCDTISEISFGIENFVKDEGKIRTGVELTPFNLVKEPFFSGKDFKIYIEHGRIKGEFVLFLKNINELNNYFGINANTVSCIFDKRESGKDEIVKIGIDNILFYEIGNFDQDKDGVYSSKLKWIMYGLYKKGAKLFDLSRSSMLWCKRMGVNIHVK